MMNEFQFESAHDVESVLLAVTKHYREELQYVESDLDIQIVCPMRKGVIGSAAISKYLQEELNPRRSGEEELKVDGTVKCIRRAQRDTDYFATLDIDEDFQKYLQNRK